ncbi:hypothetical protein LJR231_000708 [Phyllobacterium sp. LjRoot231]|uniref:hypothetical protein n=1 Tax=Phyllobacterium sp. LjRoot231 TaxID=3342289 RepID=UPI003ECFEBEC
MFKSLRKSKEGRLQRLARSNAELVEIAVEMSARHGRRAATCNEARANYGEGFFFEIVERKGYKGYGAPNAIFRIAAQKRYTSPQGMPKKRKENTPPSAFSKERLWVAIYQ